MHGLTLPGSARVRAPFRAPLHQGFLAGEWPQAVPEPPLAVTEPHISHNALTHPAPSADTSVRTSLRNVQVWAWPRRGRFRQSELDDCWLPEAPIPSRTLMTRLIRIASLVLALAAGRLSGCASVGTDGWAGAALRSSNTPLPPGWELCVLQGVNAPATAVNVADLDQWQAAEGGSTNNTAAYNPFNTRRMTDASGAPIPGVISSNGFPAFASWAAGCEATVATLFQPNMWSITAALRAGTIAPAGAFLAMVDQSAWCAPSADGVPCYASAVLGVAGSLPDVVAHSSALDVYGNVKSDLLAYQLAVAAVTADQGVMAARSQQLAVDQSQLSAARAQANIAARALRRFAIDEYVNSGLYSSASLANLGIGVNPHSAQDADGVIAQQYLGITATDLMAHESVALAAVHAALSRRGDAARALTLATLTWASDNAAERHSLSRMVADVATMQNAGACTTVAITAPPPSGTAPTAAGTTVTTVPRRPRPLPLQGRCRRPPPPRAPYPRPPRPRLVGRRGRQSR